jgi:hypothetical protein
MERARSEQRLNSNTPNTNILPQLDVVDELPPPKKMNLK